MSATVPGTGPQTLLDRVVKDGIEPDATLEQAVATVAYLYATIGGMVESSDQRLTYEVGLGRFELPTSRLSGASERTESRQETT